VSWEITEVYNKNFNNAGTDRMWKIAATNQIHEHEHTGLI
jgi:hypothetical protein